jgi:hypothetical protein
MGTQAVLDELRRCDAHCKKLQREMKELRLDEKGWRGEVIELKRALSGALHLIENPFLPLRSRNRVLEDIDRVL